MKRAALLPALLAALALAPAGAVAAPTVAGTFPLPSVADQPGRLTLGPDGNAWVVLGGGSNDVAKVTPGGTVTTYAITGLDQPAGIAAGPDGNLWVTQPGAVARFSPASPTTAQTFAQPAITVAEPIATGPDGNLWTASGATVLQIPPADPAATQSFTVPGMMARGISATSDSIWIADVIGNRLVQLTTSGTPTSYPTGVGSNPTTIAGGTGGSVAYADTGMANGNVGYAIPPGQPTQVAAGRLAPTGVALGADQAWWFSGADGDLGRLTAAGSLTTPLSFASGYGATAIAAGAGGTLWVSLTGARPAVGLVTGIGSGPSGTTAPTPLQTVQAPTFSSVKVARTSRQGNPISLAVLTSNARTLTVQVDRKLPGRRAGRGRCVAPARAPRSAARCTHLQRAVAFTRQVRGLTRARFGAGLPAGAYQLTLVAAKGSERARVVRALTIEPASPRRR